MLDLIVRGGLVVRPDATGIADVGIAAGKIVAVAAPEALGGVQAIRTIDARDRIVIPGGIDPHIHCNWPIQPPKDGNPPQLSAGPDVVSRAALYGGTTTLIDFAVWNAGESAEEALARRDRDWRGKCHCDYGFHVTLFGKVPPATISELPEALQAGFPTVKIFTTNIRPIVRDRKVGFGDIWEVLKVTGRHGGLACIHAEEDDLVMHMYEKLISEGRAGFENMAEVHTALSEDLAFRHIIRLAENVEGAALYMMHVSAGTGVAAIRESRARGYPIYGETLHQYMLYNADDYKRPNGQMYHTYPSLKTAADQAALWRGTVDGEISTVATDGICTSLCTKVQGKRIDDTTGGSAGVEPRLSVMYTEMVVKRGYSLAKFVDHVSTNAARLMGLYPRKGVIAPGADADLVVFDPGIKRKVRVEDLHEADYTPWEGHEIAGWPETTILRGKVMVEKGVFYGEGKGERLPRKIADAIRSRPAC
ncbi:MAG TPA: amidohydrolase family protein [Burkholderiales bacterium]|nr:amidohydrolase family protein [Burkholderiales bacterium]